MRKIYFLLLIQFLVIAAFGQRHEPVNPQRDKQSMEGFTVCLKEAPGDSYLFDIFKDSKPYWILQVNPFTNGTKGLVRKEDNYKVARWLIKEYTRTGAFPRLVPPHVSLELGIDVIAK